MCSLGPACMTGHGVELQPEPQPESIRWQADPDRSHQARGPEAARQSYCTHYERVTCVARRFKARASAAAGNVCPVSPTPAGIRVLCTLSRREVLERAASTDEFVEHAVECAESD
jgi:hypothetical protein